MTIHSLPTSRVTGAADRPRTEEPDETMARKIAGVQIERVAGYDDHRGTLFPFLDFERPFWTEPVVHGYLFTIRPGRIKGWGMHLRQAEAPAEPVPLIRLGSVQEGGEVLGVIPLQDSPSSNAAASGAALRMTMTSKGISRGPFRARDRRQARTISGSAAAGMITETRGAPASGRWMVSCTSRVSLS